MRKAELAALTAFCTLLAACGTPFALRQAQGDTYSVGPAQHDTGAQHDTLAQRSRSVILSSERSERVEGALLYVSDLGTFTVHVYEYPSLKPAGKLTGFDEPQGLCADAAGNVWVTNTESFELREYAHGGTSPIAKLQDAFGYPVGCAVDRATGNLAVTNIENFSGAGIVLIYKHARGTPAVYSNDSIHYYYFAGYDGSGNLYVSGQTSQRVFALGVLPRGAHTISLVTISGGTIHFPGTVAWSGSQLVLGDQKCKKGASSCLYRLNVSGRTAQIAGSTPLGGACDVAQAWVGSGRVAGGEYQNCSHKPSGAAIWPFPKGGNPAARVSGLRQPVGAVVSTSGGS